MKTFFVMVLFLAPILLAQPGEKLKEKMSPAQQQNVEQLKSDASSAKQGSQVTQAQKNALKNDLYSMVKSGHRPDEALVDQLATDLSAALADGKISGVEKKKLMKDMEKVMDSAGISSSQVNQAITDAQAILTASGVSKSAVQAIVSDLKAIAGEAQKNAPAKAQSFRDKVKKQYR